MEVEAQAKRYRVLYTDNARNDIIRMKRYILSTFGYRELGETFTKKIKEGVDGLKILPAGYHETGFRYRGYDIFMKLHRTYLILYTVDNEKQLITVLRILKDGMNWTFILERWLQKI